MNRACRVDRTTLGSTGRSFPAWKKDRKGGKTAAHSTTYCCLRSNMDDLQNITVTYTSSYSSLATPLSNLSLPSSNLSIPVSPPFPPLDLHHPLPTIIVTLVLFLLFGGCVSVLAVCCSSRRSEELDGGCGLGGDLYCGQSSPSEPQLKLWKRLGSVRRSFSSAPSFRRPPQPSASAQSRLQSKLALQLEQDRIDPQVQLTLPCLLQYATEI
ncbi:hypothetical protein SRHO_G00036340 [Serrasalmus rhombeus]